MGVGISAIGGFAQGLAGGMKLRSDLDDAEQRRKLAEAQDKREGERATREQTVFGYTLKDLQRRENKASDEDSALDELKASFIGGQPAAAPAAPQPAQAIANPNAAPAGTPAVSDFSGIPTPAQPAPAAGITPPAAADAPAAPAAAPGNNPFVTPVTGKDLDAVYDRQAKALQKYFVAKGEPDKAMQVPKMMQELRDFDWSSKVGASLAGMAGGAPGARDAFAKVYGVVNDGYDLDPSTGKYDPKTGWTGLVRVNKQTGDRETFNLSPDQAMVLASKYKNPGEVIKFVVENEQKNRQIGAQEETARAHTTSAGAALMNAQTNADVKRDMAATNRDTRETNAAIRQSVQATKSEGEAQKFFRNSFGVGDFSVKTKDEVEALMPEAKREYAAARQKHETAAARSNAATGLWDLNERKFSPSFISNAIPIIESRIRSGKGADGTDEATGLPYININGKKVLIPKD